MSYMTDIDAAFGRNVRTRRMRNAARMLNVSRWTLRKWRKAGTGPRWMQVGPYVRYPLPEIHKWGTGVNGDEQDEY